MTETIGKNPLQDPSLVNPFEISGEVKPRKSQLPWQKKYDLTESEIKDLLKINPGKMTLEDIQDYATNHTLYYESWGRVRFNSHQEKDFKEARLVNSLLKKGEHRKLAAFFLQKAKDGWRGIENNGEAGETYNRVFGIEEVVTVPQNVIAQGDTAIRRYLDQQKLGVTFRMARTNPATYLQQASVLARIINGS